MEVSQKEVVEFYDQFYSEDDFHYYPEDTSMRVLAALCRFCSVQPGARVLDVGCGTGFYTQLFHRLGYDATGIDISASGIEKAKRTHPGVRFEVQDATAMTFEPDSFDVVFALGVSVANTRDMNELHVFIRHLMHFVAPGGVLMFLGGSNLSGRTSRTSTWFNHRWRDIVQFIPEGNWETRGPFLSHFRLLERLPSSLPLNPVTTTLLRFLGGGRERKVVYFVRKN